MYLSEHIKNIYKYSNMLSSYSYNAKEIITTGQHVHKAKQINTTGTQKNIEPYNLQLKFQYTQVQVRVLVWVENCIQFCIQRIE